MSLNIGFRRRIKYSMNIPDNHHVMRHVPFRSLIKDEDGNAKGGFFPQAFELREGETGLSVNWLEYFNGTYDENKESSVRMFRKTRKIGKKSAFATGNVKKLRDTCAEKGYSKVLVILDEDEDNKSHSLIIRLPQDDQTLFESLATDVFSDYLADSDIRYV